MEMIGNQELCAPRVKDLNLNSKIEKQIKISNEYYHQLNNDQIIDET